MAEATLAAGGKYTVPASATYQEISAEQLVELFRTDGRYWGLMSPYRLVSYFAGMTLETAPPPRLVDASGQRWKTVAAAMGKDFALTASVMRGAGRELDEERHEDDQAAVDGYVLVDTTIWPVLRVMAYHRLWLEGMTTVTRTKFENDWAHTYLF